MENGGTETEQCSLSQYQVGTPTPTEQSADEQRGGDKSHWIVHTTAIWLTFMVGGDGRIGQADSVAQMKCT
jgi:hypothetical protein